MAPRKKKETEHDAELVLETNEVLVFKANRPLDEKQFNLLSDLVRNEEEKSGIKIVVAPHSVDVELKEGTKEE
jgi:hypothetical protein